jgi:hypothetical protein
MKGASTIAFLAPYIAKNLQQIAVGQRPSNQLPERLPFFCGVSLGPEYGIMILNGLVSGNNSLGKAKFDVTDKFAKLVSGDAATK